MGYVRRSRANQGKPVANAAAWLEGGKVVVDYAKILLPFYDVFDESRYFEPGSSVCVHEFGGFRVGITICEDVWNDKHFWANRLYTRDPVEECVAAGANLLLNIASSPYNTEKIQLRYDMLKTIADAAGNSRGLREPRGGKRSVAFRWLQPGFQRPRRACGPRPRLCRGSGDF